LFVVVSQVFACHCVDLFVGPVAILRSAGHGVLFSVLFANIDDTVDRGIRQLFFAFFRGVSVARNQQPLEPVDDPWARADHGNRDGGVLLAFCRLCHCDDGWIGHRHGYFARTIQSPVVGEFWGRLNQENRKQCLENLVTWQT